MSPSMLKPILSRFSDVDLLIPEGKELEFSASLAAIASSDYAKLVAESPMDHIAANDDFWGDDKDGDWKKALRPYTVVNGILQIPIRGVLLNNFPYQLFGWATGYAYIWEAWKRGMSDGNVKGIALIIHSPGGEVAGNFDLVDRMYAMRDQKPVRTFAHEYAYSAAFSIGTVAPQIIVSRSGGTGSVGVVTSHVDVSKMMDDIGWKVTFIHFGEHKVDGHPYAALPKDVKERIQARIDAIGEEFVSIVARNRGMDAEAVRATQALTYPAQEAIKVRFADAIGPLDDALVVFEADINQQTEEDEMSDKDTNTITAEAHATAVANAKAEGKAEGHKEGMEAGKTRIKTILGTDTAKARPKAAMSAALNTDMSAEQAEEFLKGVDPETKAETPAKDDKAETDDKGGKDDKANATQQNFTDAMSKDKPDVGADADAGDKDKDDDIGALAGQFGLAGFDAPAKK